MKRKDLYEKYADTILEMFKVTGDDKSVCIDKLISNVRNLDNPNVEQYFVPEGFDYVEFEKDYEELIAVIQE